MSDADHRRIDDRETQASGEPAPLASAPHEAHRPTCAAAGGTPMDRNELPLRYSLYLDGLRFTAALMVFFSHVGQYPFTARAGGEAPPAWLQQYGAPAVTIFFVLSGYVIAYVVATRERDARSYTISRVSRLYSVVVAALVLTLLFDTWGAAVDPGLCAGAVVSPDPITTRAGVNTAE